jgi:hypothetical protein
MKYELIINETFKQKNYIRQARKSAVELARSNRVFNLQRASTLMKRLGIKK